MAGGGGGGCEGTREWIDLFLDDECIEVGVGWIGEEYLWGITLSPFSLVTPSELRTKKIFATLRWP